jgi:hypothetical protein
MNEVWMVLIAEGGMVHDDPCVHVFDSEEAARFYTEEVDLDPDLEMLTLKLDIYTSLPPNVGRGIATRSFVEYRLKALLPQ